MTTSTFPSVKLGTSGPSVGRIGFGAMGLSGGYGEVDEAQAIATINAVLDSGANLIDTGDFYGAGHNEMLIGKAIAGRPREDSVLSVKFGGMRDPQGGWNGFDARPIAVRNFLTYTLTRLGVDYIDIYRPGRLDPNVPIEDTVGAIADMVEAGYVRHIGLSEVGPDTLRRAAAVHPISDLQIEYSLVSRDIETEILDVCRELGIGVTAYGVLSRGLLGNSLRSDSTFGAGDFRAQGPRFQGENLTRNLALVETLAEIATDKGVSTAQLAVAWVLAQGSDIVPLVGTRRSDRWAETLNALDITLTTQDLAAIESAVPADQVAGERYPTPLMSMLDSER